MGAFRRAFGVVLTHILSDSRLRRRRTVCLCSVRASVVLGLPSERRACLMGTGPSQGDMRIILYRQ